MNESDDGKSLIRNLSFIKENITDIDGLMDKMIEDGVLRLEDRTRILVNRNPRLQIHDILEIVVKKGAYGVFIEALEASGNSHIVDKLQSTVFVTEKRDVSKDDSRRFDESDGVLHFNRNVNNIEKLQKEITNLQHENDHLRDQQTSVRLELDSKESKLRDLQNQVNNHKAKNETLRSRLNMLSSNTKVTERLQKIEREIIEKDKDNAKIEEEIRAKDEEIKILQEECKQLREELAAKTSEISYLNEQTRALREDLALASKERKELKIQLDDMNDKFNSKWSKMMAALETRLNTSRSFPPRSLDDKETHLPTVRPNHTSTLRFIDNRYSMTPKDKMKVKLQTSTNSSPRHVTNKKTAFVTTKTKSFNKYLK